MKKKAFFESKKMVGTRINEFLYKEEFDLTLEVDTWVGPKSAIASWNWLNFKKTKERR